MVIGYLSSEGHTHRKIGVIFLYIQVHLSEKYYLGYKNGLTVTKSLQTAEGTSLLRLSLRYKQIMQQFSDHTFN